VSTETDGQVIPGEQARRGRPRDPDTEVKILGATRAILAESGMRALTVEAVAARAGVAKTTIYRRYRSRHDLALAVLVDMIRTVTSIPDLGDTRRELIQLLRGTLIVLGETLMGRVMQGLVTELASDPHLSRAFREQVIPLRRGEVARALERGVARGDLRPDPDVALVHELLFGPVYYRLLLSGEALEPVFADLIVDALLPGLRAEPRA
jgi:AcrR family transcriptional regulator